MLTIGKAAEAGGVSPSALRYYESVGLLPQTERQSGQRRYPPDIVKRIRVIKTAQQAGFQIHEIHTLLQGFDVQVPPSDRWKQLAEKKKQELEQKSRQIEQMKHMLDYGLACSCLSWDECFVHEAKFNS